MYADDVALTVSGPTFREAELALSHDISVVNAYRTKWKFRLSVEKTVCSVFHLKNHSTNYQLNVKLKPNVTVKFDSHPSNLGTCLDRSLSFRTHLHTLKKKALSRVALMKRLAGVGWGASFCCNLSGGIALIVWFTTNGMCVKNNTIIYVARASNSKRDCKHDLCCCLLPRCEALRTFRSRFPIATKWCCDQDVEVVPNSAFTHRTCDRCGSL